MKSKAEQYRAGEYGFCYVADCEGYIDEAMQSIASLRVHMPDAPVAIVTRRELFREDPLVTDWVAIEQARKGPIVKTDARLVPYERVVFLDADTLIIADLGGLFGLLEKFDFACAHEPNGHPEYGIGSGVPEAFLEPNTGVFAFRKTPAVMGFFDTWIAEYDRLHADRGVANDQPSARIALWKSDSIRHLALAREYNLITHANCSVSGPIAVIHDRSEERHRLARTVNQRIEARAIVSGYGPVYGFAGRRGWIRQHIRLTQSFLRILFRPGYLRQEGHPVIWWRDGID